MIEERRLHWRGINHLALVTTDMDATVRFVPPLFLLLR